jgi:hypothetical protein
MKGIKMRRLFLILSLILSPIPVKAEFVYFDKTIDEKTEFLLDYSSKRKVGGSVKIWVRAIYNSPIGLDNNIFSTKSQMMFDCKNDTYKTIYMVFYKDKESTFVRDSVSGDGTWKPVVPDSMWDGILKQVCQ